MKLCLWRSNKASVVGDTHESNYDLGNRRKWNWRKETTTTANNQIPSMRNDNHPLESHINMWTTSMATSAVCTIICTHQKLYDHIVPPLRIVRLAQILERKPPSIKSLKHTLFFITGSTLIVDMMLEITDSTTNQTPSYLPVSAIAATIPDLLRKLHLHTSETGTVDCWSVGRLRWIDNKPRLSFCCSNCSSCECNPKATSHSAFELMDDPAANFASLSSRKWR